MICAKNGEKVAIFSLEDARVASYSLEFRGREYPNIIRDNKQILLRQRTPTGTCGRGIGWGIALPDAHEQRARVPHLHIGTWRDSRADK